MADFPTVVDRNVQYPNRFRRVFISGDETDAQVDLTPASGAGVLGTELNAAFFTSLKAYIDGADTGMVKGPASAVDNHIAVFDGVTGKLVKDSTIAITNMVPDGSVTADKIATSAVTTDKILNEAVTADKLATSAATADKIATSAVTTDKIADSSVTTDKIANSSVTAAKLSGIGVPVLLGTFAPSTTATLRTLDTGKKFSDYKKILVIGSGYDNNSCIEAYTSLFSASTSMSWYSTIPAGAPSYQVTARYAADTQLYITTGTDVVTDVKVYGVN